MRSEICQALHIDTEALSDKYLGLPVLVGADRSDSFVHFIERIIQRINGPVEVPLGITGSIGYPITTVAVVGLSRQVLPQGR